MDFVITNSADPDEITHRVAFHLGLPCSVKYPIRGFWYTKGIQMLNISYIRVKKLPCLQHRHRALGRDATFSWSRALTHPPRCNRTRHRDRHLVSDFLGPPSWISRRGGRHLGSEVVGPPSWTGGDVKNAKVEPILLIIIPFAWIIISSAQVIKLCTRNIYF